MGKGHKHADRDAFVKKHYDEIDALVNEGKFFSTKIQVFVNDIVRPELGYSAKTDPEQIWVTLRKAFAVYRKQLAGDTNFKSPLHQDPVFQVTISFEDWRAELIRVTAEKTGHPEADVKINDEAAREWYNSGATPYTTFRETWQNENDAG